MAGKKSYKKEMLNPSIDAISFGLLPDSEMSNARKRISRELDASGNNGGYKEQDTIPNMLRGMRKYSNPTTPGHFYTKEKK